MTTDQISISKGLGRVNYLPGSADKRYGRFLAGLAEREPDKEISEPMTEIMYRLLYKYRRQLRVLYELHKNHPHCQKRKK
jgi:hypothetical protein